MTRAWRAREQWLLSLPLLLRLQWFECRLLFVARANLFIKLPEKVVVLHLENAFEAQCVSLFLGGGLVGSGASVDFSVGGERLDLHVWRQGECHIIINFCGILKINGMRSTSGSEGILPAPMKNAEREHEALAGSVCIARNLNPELGFQRSL